MRGLRPHAAPYGIQSVRFSYRFHEIENPTHSRAHIFSTDFTEIEPQAGGARAAFVPAKCSPRRTESPRAEHFVNFSPYLLIEGTKQCIIK